VTLEERLLYIAEDPFGLCDKKSLLKIALEVRKMEDRIKQLEEAGDAMDLYSSPHDSKKWNKAKGQNCEP